MRYAFTALAFGLGTSRQQMLLALAAYLTYVVNAAQFVLKLRAARMQAGHAPDIGRRLETVR